MTTAAHWLQAVRPHTLPAAVVPVLVGSGLAAGAGVFRGDALAVALLGAVAIQVAANFANDVSDARRGADPPERLGPTRAVAAGLVTPRQMWAATWMAFGVAAMAGAYLVAIAGWVIAAVGIASILATLGYVGGPFPYGYHGLGEVFVFVFFGPVATVSTRYVHADHAAPLAAWLLAIPVGLLVSAILVANNIRDLDTDRATGKRTLAVLIGRDRTRALYAALVWGTFVAVAIFGMAGWAPRATTLAALLAPLAVPLVRSARRATDGPTLVALLKGTARLHLVVGLALAATAIIG